MRALAFRAASILAAFGGLAAAAQVQPVPPAGNQATVGRALSGSVDLYLEVFINGTSTGLIGRFLQEPDGTIAIESTELVDLGLLPEDGARRPDGLINVALLSGVSFEFDAATQTINFEAATNALATLVIDAREGRETGTDITPSGWGALINYGLTVRASPAADAGGRVGFSAGLEPRLYGPLGVVSANFAINSANDGMSVVRLDTTWSFSSVNKMLTFRAGDVISGGLSWTHPVRLGGLQIQRNFALRPDLVTSPVPRLSGSASVPSTLEVYINALQALSLDVPQGPFEIVNLPLATGAGEARIVVRDATGNETVLETPFFSSPQVLRPGLLDFSFDIGFPRSRFGTESNAYAGTLMGSATFRLGVIPRLTLEGHVEGGPTLLSGGLGSLFLLGRLGTGSLAVLGSRSEAGTGYQFVGAFDLSFNRLNISAQTLRTFGAFHDIASISALADCLVPCDPARTTVQDQVALSIDLGRFGYLGLSYTSAVIGAEPAQFIGASYNTEFRRGGSFSLGAFAGLHDGSFRASASLSIPIGGAARSSISATTGRDGTNLVSTMSGSSGAAVGGVDWTVSNAVGPNAGQTAIVNYRSPFGNIAGGVSHSANRWQALAQIDGALVVAGGGVFLTPTVQDAFAVVDVGVPGVDVYYENTLAGHTNDGGRLLLAGLRSYEVNAIAIDPVNLPIDAAFNETTMLLVPAYQHGVVARFEVTTAETAAIVILRDRQGVFLPVGSIVSLEGTPSDFIVGYDGMAYISGLGPRNRILVNLPAMGSCQAEFAYTPQSGEQVQIPVVCLELQG